MYPGCTLGTSSCILMPQGTCTLWVFVLERIDYGRSSSSSSSISSTSAGGGGGGGGGGAVASSPIQSTRCSTDAQIITSVSACCSSDAPPDLQHTSAYVSRRQHTLLMHRSSPQSPLAAALMRLETFVSARETAREGDSEREITRARERESEQERARARERERQRGRVGGA